MTGRTSYWSARGAVVLGMITLALLFGVLGGWGALTTLSGAIIAPGQIEVAQNRQVVQHPDGGVVEKINVIEGSTVAAGDVLIQLDGNQLKSELAIVENQLFEIIARRGRLEAERDDATSITFPKLLTDATTRPEVLELVQGQTKLFEVRGETLKQQIEQFDKRAEQIASQIEGIVAQQDAMTAQRDLLDEELGSQQTLLDKGLAQAARVLSLQREEARLAGEIGQLKSEKAQAEGRITEIALEKLNLSSKRREEAVGELRDVAYRELELIERQRALVERISRLEIRAPVSGIVLGLQVTTPRSVLRAAEPVLYLIPQDRPLVIAAKVPTIHIDQLFLGQEVRLHFSAFSARTTPELIGVVTVISADALKDERTQLSYYRIEVLLQPGELQKLGAQSLVPGMPVEAFVRTDDRTPLAYLIKPFADYFNRAFRET